MQKLNLPNYHFKTREADNNKEQIFDFIRRKFVALTPEEWVRQNFLRYLTEEKGFPKGLIAVEMSLDISSNKQRCDVVCFNKNARALVVIECKAPKVKITQEVFEQAARYNMKLQTSFVMMTNGMNHYCCQIDYTNKKVIYLQDIPHYKSIEH